MALSKAPRRKRARLSRVGRTRVRGGVTAPQGTQIGTDNATKVRKGFLLSLKRARAVAPTQRPTKRTAKRAEQRVSEATR